MYMQDGKPVIPYGRRAPGVNKIEFNELVERLMAIEAKVAELESSPQFVIADEPQKSEDHEPQEGDKPKRGRKPKGAVE